MFLQAGIREELLHYDILMRQVESCNSPAACIDAESEDALIQAPRSITEGSGHSYIQSNFGIANHRLSSAMLG